MQLLLRILILVLIIFGIKAKFNADRLKPGSFEYSKLNGWMYVNEAVELCEADEACGGFTFKGSYKTKNVQMEIYFFHIVKSNIDSLVTQEGLKSLLLRFDYLKETFPYLKSVSLNIGQVEKYPYWSTYEVERGFIRIPKTNVKSNSSSETFNG